MLERTIVRQVLACLREHGAYAEKVHGSAYQPAMIDVVACYKGHFIGIECKGAGGKLTKRQLATLNQIRDAEGDAIVAYGSDDVLALIRRIDGD